MLHLNCLLKIVGFGLCFPQLEIYENETNPDKLKIAKQWGFLTYVFQTFILCCLFPVIKVIYEYFHL